MKVIFLDIDGVLNSMDWYKRRTRVKAETWKEYNVQEFDPEAVKLLKRIIDETGAKIVLSSTWRLHEDNRQGVRDQGIDFISHTPRLPRPSGTSVEYCERGREIKAWLDHMYTPDDTPLRYVIIDDDTDMLPEQAEHCFHTDNKFGLTLPIAKEIIWYLNKK